MANSFSFISLVIFSLTLITNVKSDSFSFNFPTFEPNLNNILIDGDANITKSGVLELTKKNYFGEPSPHSVGLSAFFGAIHLSDKSTGQAADFTTDFSFVVNPKGSNPHGDGFTFFLASQDFDFPEDNAAGGFFGIFDKETAFNTSKNSIVAVEFDSFSNEWDPNFPEGGPHIGIDINTIRSTVTAPWPIDSQAEGAIGKARITYLSGLKELIVVVTYPNSPKVKLLYSVDLATILSEYVLVGFSASTGELVETHDILSWSFTSFL